MSKKSDQLTSDWTMTVYTTGLDPAVDAVSISYRYWRQSETSGKQVPPSQAASASASGQSWSCGGDPCQKWTATVPTGANRYFDWRAGSLDVTAQATRTSDGQTANPRPMTATIAGVS